MGEGHTGKPQENQSPNTGVQVDQSRLVDSLQDQIRCLREQLDAEREARTEERRRQDTIIAQLSSANAEQARALRSIEGARNRAQGEQQPTQGGEDTMDASAPSTNLMSLLVVAPIGPGSAAILFEASLWGPPSVQTWFYVSAVFALLPAVLGFVYGRNEVVRLADLRALGEATNQGATGPTDGASPPKEPNDITRSMFGGLTTGIATGYLAVGGIALLHGLYAKLFSPTVVLVPLVSAVLAALLWISFAFLGWGLQRQRALRRAGIQRGMVNWRVIFLLLGSLATVTVTVVAAVWGATITQG